MRFEICTSFFIFCNLIFGREAVKCSLYLTDVWHHNCSLQVCIARIDACVLCMPEKTFRYEPYNWIVRNPRSKRGNMPFALHSLHLNSFLCGKNQSDILSARIMIASGSHCSVPSTQIWWQSQLFCCRNSICSFFFFFGYCTFSEQNCEEGQYRPLMGLYSTELVWFVSPSLKQCLTANK